MKGKPTPSKDTDLLGIRISIISNLPFPFAKVYGEIAMIGTKRL